MITVVPSPYLLSVEQLVCLMAGWADRWGDLPWRVYDSSVWDRHPTFAESEVCFCW